MKLVMNIKPSRVEASTIPEAKRKATRSATNSWEFSSYCSASSNETDVIAYNIEKHNTKRKRTKSGWKVVKKGVVYAYVYRFNIELLKAMNLKVIQEQRNFKIVNSK